MTMAVEDRPSERLQSLADALQSGKLGQARGMLNALYPAEIADLLESLPLKQRKLVWEMVAADQEGDVLLHVNENVRASLIHDMEAEELVAATEGLPADDLADILQDLPEVVIREVFQSLDAQQRRFLEQALSYPEDTAGGLMNMDIVTVRTDITLEVVQRYLRRRAKLPEMTDSLFVVSRDNTYRGRLALSELLTRDPELTVRDTMVWDWEPVLATLPASEVAGLFEHRDLISAPVVDDQGRLLGRITVDDVVDVIRDEAEHSLMGMAGFTEEQDMFAPVLSSMRRRALWLGVNLGTAFFASWVIGLFDKAIDELVALAILMPIVASMGGIAGTQTLAVVIRGMVLGQIGYSNAYLLVAKELAVGSLNGVMWAAVVATVAIVWFNNYSLGAIIAAAMLINLACAGLIGATMPLLLRRLGIDPAIAGGVVLTTFTDVIGFIAFLGLATLFLI